MSRTMRRLITLVILLAIAVGIWLWIERDDVEDVADRTAPTATIGQLRHVA